MQAKCSKRLIAYLIDMVILGLVLSIIGIFLPQNKNVQVLNIELDSVNEQLLNEEINLKEYVNHYSEIMYQLDKENIIYTIVNTVFIILYFIIMPYFFNGQTLGKKMCQIKVSKIDGELTINDLIIRNLLINGLGYLLLSLVLIYLMSSLTYFINITLLSIIQLIIIVITIIGFIKKKEDFILHDRFTNTTVINL